MIPQPHQIIGANFLSGLSRGLLADAPRVGKTGAAIMAADDILAQKVLVITTASGRPVWEKAWSDWSMFDLPVRACYGTPTHADLLADRVIVSWGTMAKSAAFLAHVSWDLIIADESHYAKSWDAQRTKALYGFPGGVRKAALCDAANTVWCLTGTPIPNALNDLHPMLRSLAPERLAPCGEWPDVTFYEDFLKRYCIVKPKRLSRWNTVQVVVGSRNIEELHARMDGFWLRRTQADVGITTPIYEVLPIHITDAQRRSIEAEIPDGFDVLAAAETEETRSLDMHLGALRRVTGSIKARGVVQVVMDEFAGGLDKIVLMAWHHDTLNHLQASLSQFGVVRVDGSTSASARGLADVDFRSRPGIRVFLGQLLACGEAIDLSAAADMIFVESSFVPKDMAQASLRITNLNQKRQPRVRVAALAGSIDEALSTVLTRKVKDIKELLTA